MILSIMKGKGARHQAILEILREHRVSNQEQLVDLLATKGYKTTQATLSRDINQLHIVKRLIEGQYVYVSNSFSSSFVDTSVTGLSSGDISLEFSGNIAVVKTIPGYAGAIASMIDKMNNSDILGTIAGDDTILLILREGADRNDIQRMIKK
jgi:transcriptional regulator of arginine metabolism